MLLKECNPEPVSNSGWAKTKKKGKCYMLAGLFELLCIQHEEMLSAYKIKYSFWMDC